MNTHKLTVILTGATGMVGEGVLHECLNSDLVESVLVVNRKPCGYTHPKLKEIIHRDFYNLTPIKDQLQGFNTCLFCLGTTSVGKNEEEFTKVSHTLTMHFAETVVNSSMVFEYISGAGTDSSEKGKIMWARVKGKTENDLMKLPFKKVYNIRPGMLLPTKGLKNTLSYYKYLGLLTKIVLFLFPSTGSKLSQLGQAMIKLAAEVPENITHIEIKDIKHLSK